MGDIVCLNCKALMKFDGVAYGYGRLGEDAELGEYYYCKECNEYMVYLFSAGRMITHEVFKHVYQGF